MIFDVGITIALILFIAMGIFFAIRLIDKDAKSHNNDKISVEYLKLMHMPDENTLKWQQDLENSKFKGRAKLIAETWMEAYRERHLDYFLKTAPLHPVFPPEWYTYTIYHDKTAIYKNRQLHNLAKEYFEEMIKKEKE